MTKTILCGTCSEVIGTLVKNEISDDDVALYQAQTVCSQGHGAVTLAEEVIPDEQ